MPRSITILNFHGIGEPPEATEPSERAYWVSEERFREILDLADRHPRAQQICFTFDDGNKSDLAIAAPALEARGRKGAFYVLAGRLDDPHYLSQADCRALVEMGMEVGLHGRDHVDWRGLGDAALVSEIDAACAEIARASGRPVTSVGIPFGAYDKRVMALLKARGFLKILTSDGGPARAAARVQNRTSIRSDMPPAKIAALIEGQEPVMSRLRRAASTTLRRHVR